MKDQLNVAIFSVDYSSDNQCVKKNVRGVFTPAFCPSWWDLEKSLGRGRRIGEVAKEAWRREGSCCAAAQIGQIFLITQIGHYLQKASIYLKRLYTFVLYWERLFIMRSYPCPTTIYHAQGSKVKNFTCTCDKTASTRNKWEEVASRKGRYAITVQEEVIRTT